MNLEMMSKDQLISMIDELESQVVALRGGNQVIETLNLQSAFGLTEYEARFLWLLSDGQPHTKDQIMNSLYYDKLDDPPESKIIDVWLSKLRSKLNNYGISIKTIWGSGYRLLDGKDIVSAAAKGDVAFKSEEDGQSGDWNRVLTELISRADKTGVATFQSGEFIETTGVTRTLQSIMASLERRDLVEVVSSARNHNTRRFNWIVRVKPLAMHGMV